MYTTQWFLVERIFQVHCIKNSVIHEFQNGTEELIRKHYNHKQDRHCTCNMILTRVRATIVAQ